MSTKHDVTELLEALRPFAEWAGGMAKVEQADAFTFKTLDDEGRVIERDICADAFAAVLAALKKAEA